jgi:phosphotriesterase-related protein
LETLRTSRVVEEAVILSTCNRVEIYAATTLEPAAAFSELKQFLVTCHDYRDPLTDEILFGQLEHGGTVKIGVDAGALSDIDRKLVVAAARCHLKTGLTIGVHTGDGVAARDILAALRGEGVSPEAFIWIHARNERDPDALARAAEAGAWVELDGIAPQTLGAHAATVALLVSRGHLRRLLVSQDAGWYHVGEPGGGSFRPYTLLFEAFLPELRRLGVTEPQVQTLLVENPARAFTVAVRRSP